jgi:hypothetical protein
LSCDDPREQPCERGVNRTASEFVEGREIAVQIGNEDVLIRDDMLEEVGTVQTHALKITVLAV